MNTHELAEVLLARPSGTVKISVLVGTDEEGGDYTVFAEPDSVKSDVNFKDTIIVCEEQ